MRDREQRKSRVMDVVHIDFSPHREETEAGREGIGGGAGGVVYLREMTCSCRQCISLPS